MYDFSKLKEKARETELWFKAEIAALRTGRATPALVEGIQIDSYGVKTPLVRLATITVEDARTLRIAPWDASLLKNIDAAFSKANLGAQPIADEKTIRLTLPLLTEERRKSLIKMVGEKMEQAKISLRLGRDEAWKDIQEREKQGTISEDEKFRSKNEMQKIIDATSEELQKMLDKKEEEILN